MQIEGREYKEDEQALVVMISKLMGLYSVNTPSPFRRQLNFIIARPTKSSNPTMSKNLVNLTTTSERLSIDKTESFSDASNHKDVATVPSVLTYCLPLKE